MRTVKWTPLKGVLFKTAFYLIVGRKSYLCR